MIKQKSLEFIIIQMVKFKKEILKKINGNGIYYYECGDKYKRNCIMVMEMFIHLQKLNLMDIRTLIIVYIGIGRLVIVPIVVIIDMGLVIILQMV